LFVMVLIGMIVLTLSTYRKENTMSLIRDALLEKCDVISVRKDGVVTKSHVLYKGDGSRIVFGTEELKMEDIVAKIAILEAQKVELTAVAVAK